MYYIKHFFFLPIFDAHAEIYSGIIGARAARENAGY